MTSTCISSDPILVCIPKWALMHASSLAQKKLSCELRQGLETSGRPKVLEMVQKWSTLEHFGGFRAYAHELIGPKGVELRVPASLVRCCGVGYLQEGQNVWILDQKLWSILGV